MDKEQQERLMEQQRVDDVIGVINRKAEALFSKAGKLQKSVVELRKGFWDDVTVNIDESDDAIETEASIKQQAELLSERERSHGLIDQQIKTLQDQKHSPYFGRIDFLEDGEKEEDKLYIGLASLMDEEENDFLVYDWRAPISSLYYDYAEGKAAFSTDNGEITGDISLKRQFIIERGKMVGMFDTGITIGDHLLQQALGNNASSTMKSIVATIQAEQNKIIRNENSKYLVVQGVAGSGKTSAALQRVAYLMYRHRNVLNENNMILFSPNPLFNSYVSHVLPELGETNMRQTTFINYIARQIEGEIQLESPFDQMEYILTKQDDPNYGIKTTGINLKSSLEFKDLIDDYILSLEENGISFKDIIFRDKILIPQEDISACFYDLVRDMTISNAISQTSVWLIEQLTMLKEKEKSEDWVMDEVELLGREEFLKASQYAQELEEKDDFYNSSAEEDFLLTEIVNNSMAQIEKDIEHNDFVDILGTYKRLYIDFSPEELPDLWDEISKQSLNDFSNEAFPFEDATPYAYFKAKLLASNADRSVRYLFVDEAQDYTAFQLAYIKYIFPYTRMTFLGDINQAIYAHTKEGNPLQAEFEDSHERIVLTKSYRSTKQIVEFTSSFSPNDELIEAFERNGDKPKLVKLAEHNNEAESIVEHLSTLQENGQETIAIICKTFAECDVLYDQLKDQVELTKINEHSINFEKGILILPIFLAKGIEFDAVIIPDASENQFNTELDKSLFYTACTRAMHELIMFSKQAPNQFLTNTSKEKYDVIYS